MTRRGERRRPRGTTVVALLIAAGLGLSACTGVPSSSSPETVEQLRLGGASASPSITAPPGADPRQIIELFLGANAADPGKRSSARGFLTRAARNRWSTDTATIINDEVIGTYDAVHRTIKVSGRVLGSLDKSGIYTPELDATSTGRSRVTFEFRLALVNGEYRIDQLRPGLLLTALDFADHYKQHSLYFYDNSGQTLVQDPRYSDIDDRNQLSEWLLHQLAAGPREQLQNAVTFDTLPAQADAAHLKVQVGAPSTVEIPGSSQLDAGARDRLAAQLSRTLDDPLSGGDVTMTDNGRPVTIPRVSGTIFGPEDFVPVAQNPVRVPEIYYLDQGRVFDSEGDPLPGPLGRGTYSLESVALSRLPSGGPMLAAGVVASGTGMQLMVGTQDVGLKPTTVKGELTRPAWAPGRREVWIAADARLYHVAVDGTVAHPVVTAVPEVAPGGRILAVRLSPDGARIALVVAAPGEQAGQLLIGAIVRDAGETRIDALEPVSPQGALLVDVAWLNPLRLLAIGHLAGSPDSLTFDTGVDGTDWSSSPVGLSSAPDFVTAAAGANAWLSAGGFVWKQSSGQWVSPSGGQTSGQAPVFLESGRSV